MLIAENNEDLIIRAVELQHGGKGQMCIRDRTLAELEAVGRAAVLIPSPNVAENHQYYNAMELQKADAAAKEKRTEMPLSDLHPFEGHPFKAVSYTHLDYSAEYQYYNEVESMIKEVFVN